jgi:hypothetical protein
MNIPVTIQINDEASQAMRIKIAKADPHRVATRAAVPLARHWRDSLAKLPKNRNGYPSTGFWEDAARRVVGVAVGGDVLLKNDKIGLKKRLYGGSTKAVKHANVTIPICAEAYGTTVADWGMDNLVLVILGDGRKFLALWLGGERGAAYSSTFKGKAPWRAAGKRPRAFQAKVAGRELPKPKVIIFKQAGSAAKDASHAQQTLKFLFRLMPETGEAAPMPQVIPADMADVANKAAMEAIR